jgi:hypothetical protein
MAYNTAAVNMLRSWLWQHLPSGGSILELGDQQINDDVPAATVLELMATAGLDAAAADQAMREHFLDGGRRVADAFRGSRYTYRCVDLFGGVDTIVANLNTYHVPDEWRGHFDIITNFGTTEHVADQVNAFRVMHDFAKVGARLHSAVPCLGYFNHGFFSYSPVFFLFLAEANEYAIDSLSIDAPHLEHTLPTSEAMPTTELWRGKVVASGILTTVLIKTRSAPFELFTDHDATRSTATRRLPNKWLHFLADRYDLRVR